METIADQQQDKMFGLVDEIADRPNVVSIMFKEQEGAFLAGAAAALMTKSNQIGFIGGMEIPVVERFHAGFVAGVAAVNPDITLMFSIPAHSTKQNLVKRQRTVCTLQA